MRFRVITETISPNGSCDARAEEYQKEELAVGRGAGCDIQLDHPSVSFSHAKIVSQPRQTQGGMGVFIEDLGSLSGVFVNNTPVTRKELALGDVITLGAIKFTVRASEGVIELFRQRRAEGLDLDGKIRRDVQELSLARKLPSFQLLSLSLVGIVLAVYFVLPVLTERRLSWSSGPIAASHKMIEHDCQSCHEGQFARISDQKCLACHTMTDHTHVFSDQIKGATRTEGAVPVRAEVEPSCASCHMDHNGSGHSTVGGTLGIEKAHGLIVHQSALCTDCHASIDGTVERFGRKAGVEAVASFAQHPEFAVTLQADPKAKPGTQGPRVRLSDTARLKDVSNIKLNHKVHLQKDLRTRTGFKTLDCSYCHTLNEDYRTIESIRFEKHCQECHSLEFDERLPGVEVPHGDPDVVYRHLYAEYAKLLLSSEAVSPARKEFQQRGGRIPGRAGTEQIEQLQRAKSADDFSRSFVEKESRGSERVLFTRTACYLCHAVDDRAISEFEAREKAVSKFDIVKPQIPDRWMPRAIFSHGAHEEVRCVDCHSGVLQSTRTADVLLPKIDNCRTCHVQHPEVGKITSDCVLCHSYHDSLPMVADRKRAIPDILVGLNL